MDNARKCFEPSEVKKWALDDLNKTIQWLESQEEKVMIFHFLYENGFCSEIA